MINYQDNLNGIQFSDMFLQYVQRFNFHRAIDAYMEVPTCIPANNDAMGWAFIPEREIYIRPTAIQQEIELRLAHEITHVALADQGYRMLAGGDDDLISALANLLHHMVLYPKLVEGGFTLEQDRDHVMRDLVTKFEYIRDEGRIHGDDYRSYAKVIILNDLIRLAEDAQDNYLLLARQVIPELTEEALSLMQLFPERSPNIDVNTYEGVKVLLEQECQENFPWY